MIAQHANFHRFVEPYQPDTPEADLPEEWLELADLIRRTPIHSEPITERTAR